MLSRITKSGQLDSAAIALSALCMVHCAAGVWLLAGFASLGGVLFAPWVHEIGFALAAVMAALALGHGVRLHGARLPLVIGVVGIAAMLTAMTVPHGSAYEYGLTLAGVAALSIAHLLNYRAARQN
ncbi:MerC domain-containing protein [Blastomonas sp.]|uniref:MerC domain-containing protein n=1 Tax=Blastomonas sp. TaxID=1909299 RepID=UPI003919B461